MEAIAQSLLDIVNALEPTLRGIPEAEAVVKPSPLKWSKKEILGHLIDSACNNQQKFVRTMLADTKTAMPGYEQDGWVNSQQYNAQSWHDIVTLWAAYNRHLAHIIRHVESPKLDHSILISGNGPYTLGFMMADYVEHLKHHLLQIIPDAGFSSTFSMTPYV